MGNNRWNIPAELEAEVRARDRTCIYCGQAFASATGPRGQQASWEHIVNDASLIHRGNIGLCCISCNASKGAKPLREWLKSRYCQRKGITPASIAEVARDALTQDVPSPANASCR